LDAWLTNRRVALCIVSLICLLAGSYLVSPYFGPLVMVLLASLGPLVGRGVAESRTTDKVEGTGRAVQLKNLRQVTLVCDYRPKRAVGRDTAFECVGAETAQMVSSSPAASNENDNVWFNFTNSEPTARGSDDKALLSGNTHPASVYD